MQTDLSGRTAIVTGSSKGIGKDIAKALATEGANVIICARDSESLTRAQDELRCLKGACVAVPVDLTHDAAAKCIVTAAVQHFSGVDILVNNAGGAIKYGGLLDLNDQNWRDAFELNVMSIVRLVREVLPWLGKSPAPRIINISSISGVQPGSFNPHYTTAKAAVINLSKYLANQLAHDNIPVNVVCPGPIHSDAWDKNVQRISVARGISFDEAKTRVEIEEIQKVPLGRIGNGGDVADLVTFLASDRAAWITGSCFHVNGGKLRSMV